MNAHTGFPPPFRMRRIVARALLPILLASSACSPDRPPDAGNDAPSVSEGSGFRASFGADDAESVSMMVFDEAPDSVLDRRLTLHLLVQEPAGRDDLSRSLRSLLPDRAASDSTLVAIRAVVYRPRVREGESEGNLMPVAWGEWIPVEGWHGEVGEGRGTGHRVYFYFGAPPEW